VTSVGSAAKDERGLIDKILVLWLLLGVLLLVFAYDGIQVAVTRFRVADAAQTAAFEGAASLRATQGDREAAYRAALQAVEDADSTLRMAQFAVDPQTGQVTVTVTQKASTLLMGRIGFLRSLTKARTTETSEPPSP